jgi:hypothetical protein
MPHLRDTWLPRLHVFGQRLRVGSRVNSFFSISLTISKKHFTVTPAKAVRLHWRVQRKVAGSDSGVTAFVAGTAPKQ